MTQRKSFSSEFKAKGAIEVLNKTKSIKKLSQDYEVYAGQISTYKIEFLKGMKTFSLIKKEGY